MFNTCKVKNINDIMYISNIRGGGSAVMTINEFVDKYAKILYEKNTEACFNEVSSIISNLKCSDEPIDLDTKIEIWKQIQEQIQILNEKDDEEDFGSLYEHENWSILTLISLTLKSLESDRGK